MTFKLKSLSAAVAASCLWPAHALAQTASTPVAPETQSARSSYPDAPAAGKTPAGLVMALDPVVVTATLTPTPVREALAATTVITRDDIERAGANDLATLLERFGGPGVDVGRNGGPGQPASVFIRGGNSDQTLVLLDGVRVNPGTGGAALALISPEMIERVEIVRGPRSTLYGSDALAGTINIITRNGRDAPLLSAQARAGSYNTREVGARAAYGTDNAQATLLVQDTHTDGFPTFRGATIDRGLRLKTFQGQASGKVGQFEVSAGGWRAEGTNEYLNADYAYPPPTFNAVLRRFVPRDQDTLNQTGRVAATWRPNGIFASTLSMEQTKDEVQQNQAPDYVNSQRPQYNWDNVVDYRGQRLRAGLLAAQDRVQVLSAFGNNIDNKRDLKGGYVQGEFRYGPNSLLLGGAHQKYDGFDGVSTYNAEYGLKLGYGVQAIAAAGTGFKAPNAYQRFGFGGVPDLRPERGRSYEAGLRYTGFKFFQADARYFRNRTTDLIVVQYDPTLPTTDPYFGYRAKNVALAETKGVELSLAWRGPVLTAGANGTLQEPTDCTIDAQGVALAAPDCGRGGDLLRRTRKRLTGFVAVRQGPVEVGVDASAQGRRADVQGQAPFGRTIDGGYSLLNASLRWQVLPGTSIDVRGENLLDRDYEAVSGYNAPGRSGYVTVRTGFGAGL